MALHFRRGGLKVARWLLLPALLAAGAAQAATILVFGDSISAAYGLEPAQGWVAKLQQRLDRMAPGRHRVVNGSLSGETTTGGLGRLPPLLAAHHPDLVVIELGGNDGLRGQPPDTIATNLRRLIANVRAAKARVVVLGIRIPPNYGRRYTEAFEQVFVQVSRETKAPLVPFFLAQGADGIVPLQADGIHPTAAAQAQLLDNAWPAIKKALAVQ